MSDLMRKPGWLPNAACLDEDPELFFPIGTSGKSLEQIARAKAVCQGCPVIGECLKFALDRRQDIGVWGGLDEDERRALRHDRRRKRKA